MAKKARCHYCDRPAEFLCDFALRHGAIYNTPPPKEADEFAAWLLAPADVVWETCDRPLCDRHRVNKGHIFMCGKAGEIVSVDYCPGHAKGPPQKPPFVPLGGGTAA